MQAGNYVLFFLFFFASAWEERTSAAVDPNQQQLFIGLASDTCNNMASKDAIDLLNGTLASLERVATSRQVTGVATVGGLAESAENWLKLVEKKDRDFRADCVSKAAIEFDKDALAHNKDTKGGKTGWDYHGNAKLVLIPPAPWESFSDFDEKIQQDFAQRAYGTTDVLRDTRLFEDGKPRYQLDADDMQALKQHYCMERLKNVVGSSPAFQIANNFIPMPVRIRPISPSKSKWRMLLGSESEGETAAATAKGKANADQMVESKQALRKTEREVFFTAHKSRPDVLLRRGVLNFENQNGQRFFAGAVPREEAAYYAAINKGNQADAAKISNLYQQRKKLVTVPPVPPEFAQKNATKWMGAANRSEEEIAAMWAEDFRKRNQSALQNVERQLAPLTQKWSQHLF